MSIKVQKHLNLSRFTTFNIGGPADYFTIVKGEEELVQALEWAEYRDLPYFILGAGSNLLISDYGIKGLVIKLENNNYQVKNKLVIAGSGMRWGSLVDVCKKNNLSGLEFSIGIPGTVGGGIVTNCGVKNKEIKDVVTRIKIYKPTKKDYSQNENKGEDSKDSQKIKSTNANNEKNKALWIDKKEAEFAYRTSRFSRTKEIVLKAEFKLDKKDKQTINKNIKKYLEARKKQPAGQSAGSIFKNPSGEYAGELIEKAGLKGKQIGAAKVSEEHANFLINTGGAKATEVIKLIQLIKNTVKEKFNIQLEEEIEIVGRF